MKLLLQRARAHPRYGKIFEWGVLISVMGSAQMIVQGIGVLSGFLIVHRLSTEEYAYYTLAYTMFGALIALADAGISNGVLAHGARCWQDRVALGSVVATGVELRRKFAFASLAVSFTILFVLLTMHGATWFAALFVLLALGPAFYAVLTEDLLEVPLKLHQDIVPLQKNQIQANVGRLALLVAGIFVLPWAAVAIMANGLPRIWANARLRKITQKYTDLSQPINPEVRKDILKMISRALPGAIYYCLSSQVSVWLISIYGNTESIAQIGALGRLAAILTIVGSIFSTLAVPRFARLPEDASTLLRNFGIAMAVVVSISIVASGVAYLFPSQMLLLLGKNYQGLNYELFLSVLGNCVTMMIGIIYALLISRTWILLPVVNIGSCLLVQVLLVMTLDVSDAKGVLIYSLLNALWGLAMHMAYFFYRIFVLRKAEIAAAT